jgi:hypothetical protein
MPKISRSEKRIIELQERIETKKQALADLQTWSRETFTKIGQMETAKRQAENSQIMARQDSDFFHALSRENVGNDYLGELVVSADPIKGIFDSEYVRYAQWAQGTGVPEGDDEKHLKMEISLLQNMLNDVLPPDERDGVFDIQLDSMKGYDDDNQ